MSVTQVVKLAAEMMDEVKPDWYQQVNTETLNIGIGGNCVAGQNGLSWMAMTIQFNEEYGKDPSISPFASPEARVFWIDEINLRLAA